MSGPTAGGAQPDWERVLSAAARLQVLLPEAVLVGGTAAGIYARHRTSHDADHVLTDLRSRFDDILGQLESVAGWNTARTNRPVLIPGSLDGIETGVRQLIRSEPLETTTLRVGNQRITIPTEAEILRIKGFLLLRRNATRDYVDFAALADRIGEPATAAACERFDELYPQDSGESVLQQMLAQLAKPTPYDLDGTTLSEYTNLEARWQDWNAVRAVCVQASTAIFDHVCDLQERGGAVAVQAATEAGTEDAPSAALPRYGRCAVAESR